MQIPLRGISAGVLIAAYAFTTPALARAGQVSARLEPDTVAPGEAATLTVSTDSDASLPSLPAIDGLDIQSIGQQTRMTSVNGVSDSSVTYMYGVQAQRPGDFSLNGIRVGASAAPALTLHVRAGAGGQNQTLGAAPPGVPLRPSAPDEAPAELAFMRVRVDKPRSYVGQSVPFTVQAYFRGGTGVALRGRPELSSDAFTVSGLDQTPTQTQIELHGVPYLAVTWRGLLTAAKPGDYKLDMSMPVSLQYREAAPVARPQPQRNTLRDLFGASAAFGGLPQDPFFDSLLDQPLFDGFLEPGRLVSKDLTLRGRAGLAHVSALPNEGKPADFSGAIGQFDLQADLSSTILTRGEPVDLHFTIRGSGNFGQFAAPGLATSSTWKAYAAHKTFEPDDNLGLHGADNYLQPIAAAGVGQLELPGLRFSYFDPDAQRYVTKKTPAVAVQVAAGSVDAPAARESSAQTGHATAPPAAAAREASVGSLARGGVPDWLLPAGLASLLLAIAASGFALFWRSSQQRRRLERWRTARLIARERRAMRRAALAGDRVASLRSGRQAIQHGLAAAWHVAPESITSHELEERWPSAPDTIRRVFELADQLDYAGGRAASAPELADLSAWSLRVDRQIAHMEVPSC